MTKAFDKVNPNQHKMIDKLYRYRFKGTLRSGSQVQPYTSKTTYLDGQLQILKVTTPGEPQGFIVGSTLLLFDYNLLNAIFSSKVATFYDNTKLIKCISTEVDSSLLQKESSHESIDHELTRNWETIRKETLEY